MSVLMAISVVSVISSGALHCTALYLHCTAAYLPCTSTLQSSAVTQPCECDCIECACVVSLHCTTLHGFVLQRATEHCNLRCNSNCTTNRFLMPAAICGEPKDSMLWPKLTGHVYDSVTAAKHPAVLEGDMVQAVVAHFQQIDWCYIHRFEAKEWCDMLNEIQHTAAFLLQGTEVLHVTQDIIDLTVDSDAEDPSASSASCSSRCWQSWLRGLLRHCQL